MCTSGTRYKLKHKIIVNSGQSEPLALGLFESDTKRYSAGICLHKERKEL